ncbi:MAG: DnaA/Hda family protein, partial [Chthoniobacterales bacterium]
MDEKCAQLWSKVSTALKPQVSADTFKRWFSAVKLTSANAEAVTLLVPNNIYQFWIESNHMPALQSSITDVLGGPRAVKFVCAVDTSAAADAAEPEPAVSSRAQNAAARANKTPGLNPRNTFESFVIGPNNEIAHAASLAVAQSPAKTYNPLFIYGGVGLGKTHLMQAIGQYISVRGKGARVMYLSSELFINEFIDAI